MNISDTILTQFTAWFEAAKAEPSIRDHHAMVFSTVGNGGAPSSRIVLLKEYDARGFVFFTNYKSHKSCELTANPNACLNFYWEALGKQIRIEGACEKVSDAESDLYFSMRPRGSQIGAWASHQSEVLVSRKELENRLRAYEAKFEGKDVPRPPHWGGWRLVPHMIEFWQEGEYRLHERVQHKYIDYQWVNKLLNP